METNLLGPVIMTYQYNLNINEESMTPTSTCLSNPGIGARHSVVRSSTDGSSMNQQNRQAGPPAKRLKSESDVSTVTNTVTKNILKRAVLDKMKARGDTEIPSNLFEEPKPCQLTSADLEKRAKRQKQNREAAKRCRAKKKKDQDMTAQEKSKFIEENVKLQQLIYMCAQIMSSLRKCLEEHLRCGDCKLCAAVQEEHMHVLNQTFSQLPSEITSHFEQDEQTLYETQTPASDCGGLEDRGLNYQPLSVDSSCEMPFSVTINSTPSNIISANNDCYDNQGLPSWDLNFIVPDILDTCVDQLPQVSSDGSGYNLMDFINAINQTSAVDNWQHNNQSREINEIFKGSSELESVLCSTSVNAIDQEDKDVTFSNLEIKEGENLTLPTSNITERAVRVHQCVPPNLVQPNISVFQTSPYLFPSSGPVARTNSYDQNISSRNTTQQNGVNPDLNNIPASRPTTKMPPNKKQICKSGLSGLNSFSTSLSYPPAPADLIEHHQFNCHSLSPESSDSYRL